MLFGAVQGQNRDVRWLHAGVNINAKQAIELVKSGAHGLLGVAEKFAKAPHRYGLRFIWCGSEERGLLGAKAYVAAHEEELKHIALNINLDMIGCIMGEFLACCTYWIIISDESGRKNK